MPYYNKEPKRDHIFDNHPFTRDVHDPSKVFSPNYRTLALDPEGVPQLPPYEAPVAKKHQLPALGRDEDLGIGSVLDRGPMESYKDPIVGSIVYGL